MFVSNALLLHSSKILTINKVSLGELVPLEILVLSTWFHLGGLLKGAFEEADRVISKASVICAGKLTEGNPLVVYKVFQWN